MGCVNIPFSSSYVRLLNSSLFNAGDASRSPLLLPANGVVESIAVVDTSVVVDIFHTGFRFY